MSRKKWGGGGGGGGFFSKNDGPGEGDVCPKRKTNVFIGRHFRDFLLRVANKYLTRIHTFHMILLSLPLVAPQNHIGFLQKKITNVHIMTNHIESQPFGWFRNPAAHK